MKIHDQISEIVEAIRKKTESVPEVLLILGSGLGALADEMEVCADIPYADIPHFPESTIAGHAGRLLIGKLSGRNVAMLAGRFHAYEGHSPATVTLPIRALQALGAKWVLITNAAGGVSPDFKPGHLMLIKDHINFTGYNPLVGPHDPSLGVRFLDMSDAYNVPLRALAHKTAEEEGIDLQEGVYLGCLGPVYETPAEIRMFRTLGADAVGMSTIPEVIVARHVGMRVLGISCISNMASGILPQPLNHMEVLETTNLVRSQFGSLVKGILARSESFLEPDEPA